MIPRILSLILLPFAYLYLALRECANARTRHPVACDGCGAGIGEDCAPTCRYADRCPHCGMGADMCPPASRDDCAAYHSLPTHGDVLSMPGHLAAERREHPSAPPVVACCYCGKPSQPGVFFNGCSTPLCAHCDSDAVSCDAIRAKLNADREEACRVCGLPASRHAIDAPNHLRVGHAFSAAARAEAGGSGKAERDEMPAVHYCAEPDRLTACGITAEPNTREATHYTQGIANLRGYDRRACLHCLAAISGRPS